jgi:hypothetical protein
MLVAADKICRPMQAEILKSRCSEARGISLAADHDDPFVVTVDAGNSMRARWIEPPLEDIPINHDRSRELTVSKSLLARSNVDHHGSSFDLLCQVFWQHPFELPAGFGEKVLDRRIVTPNFP